MLLTRFRDEVTQRIFSMVLISLSVMALIMSLRSPAASQDRSGVTAGEFVVEPPTLIALGFEWYIDGDANRNASVAVSYRKKGSTEWKEGLPMFRLNGERTVTGLFNDDPTAKRIMTPDANAFTYVAPNMF